MKKFITIVTAMSAAASVYALPPTLTATVTVRDFSSRSFTPFYNPNFEKPLPISGLETGIVATLLPASKIPLFTGPGTSTGPSSVTTAADFAEWWSPTVDGAPNNAPFTVDLTSTLIGTVPVDLPPDCCGTLGIYKVDFVPFFPIDGAGSGGGVPTQGTGGYYGNQGRLHNYGFTIQYNTTFTYIPGGTALTFTGDDDLWVYVDGKLVLDLGGVHPPLTDGFILNALTTDVDGKLLNLVACEEYDIDFYYAERHTPNSDLTLTFTVFERTLCPEANAMAPSLALTAAMAFMALRRRRATAA